MHGGAIRCFGCQQLVVETDDFLQGSCNVSQFNGCQNIVAVLDDAMQFGVSLGGRMMNYWQVATVNLFDNDFQRAG